MSGNHFKTYRWLKPAAYIYRLATDLRNALYDRKVLDSYSAPFPVICIGNITAGGTGKTPQAEYLLRLLQDKFRTALLSRGYGRATKGYILSSDTSTPGMIGDEPFQMSRKFTSASIAVCEDRVKGLKELELTAHPDVVILDDAFQHRAVRPSLSILLINWNRDIHSDLPIPAGLLREKAANKKRADIIIVTKCPDSISESQMTEFTARISPDKGQKVFFSRIRYGELIPWNNSTVPRTISGISQSTAVTVATGIASPQPIIDMLKGKSGNISNVAFNDHHRYTDTDISRIAETYGKSGGNDRIVIITEKDSVKIRNLHIGQDLAEHLYILPVETEFITGKDEFDNIIIGHIENFNKR